MSEVAPLPERAAEFRRRFHAVQEEIGKVVVGQPDIVSGVLTCLFVGGHCLLEGVPGLGKTLLVRTLAQVLDLEFNRIQFTPDLMPSDILGTNIITETESGGRAFQFQRGPIFAQIVLADEINRATPKTQSALLEAMQEHRVTIGGKMHQLEEPFFVLATQNPIEQEGTYPLPEAQLDRFLFKLIVPFVTREELATILDRTTRNDWVQPQKIMDGREIQQWQSLVREVLIAPAVQDYAIRLVLATHPESEFATEPTKRFLRCGASPRGAQTMILAAKVRALLAGRYNVSFDDLRSVYFPAMRHRVLLNFEAQAENLPPDQLLQQILALVPEKAELAAR
ncbi:AAA family ATPase [Tuwongella immobilis]|uniref:AAA+ ATPase domain-containing protein n=1 Tax=Tuwongella immobilis TaxID=692036 RepID=A0A6C2YLS6_9BACT|nr:MoxR family ATPase [Tuwongella immobilis]VIP02528.1 atpase aaa : MoxR-like ATPase OS=Singulisphaera acidiphila (strain ATCC BAA-1392 / DSM 18658 / VKM B-2454 / MOB10) GN=Sinac_2616 PE=4 SV=1: AAA_3 [Tuwongella immobilis]VTS01673.1 atpase aaa : MoxR-like ATPase OS=Singulisphaera acidiphila (strain ATCC BAA-1392 / DSM 18658 / VKM B-2454 / MOB10) GN=Sinac_2616 PE=4 SV=1: AAA_3 [Tuwongella immobilis]